MLYPSTVIDNFLDHPEWYTNLMRTMPLYDNDGMEYKGRAKREDLSLHNYWTGYRTEPFILNNKIWQDYLTRKVLSIYYEYPDQMILSTSGSAYFHYRPAGSFQDYKDCSIHNDVVLSSPGQDKFNLAGVVYLSENCDPDTGTSIFSRKRPILFEAGDKDCETFMFNKHQFDRNNFSSPELKREVLLAKERMEEKFFSLAIEVKNAFNRLIVYDASYTHRANKLCSNKDRWSLVFFLKIDHYDHPIPRINRQGW